tara:strand:+ start:2719 stop:3300 length:582 start_codon:yes stop_codon:yes gene_type:complete
MRKNLILYGNGGHLNSVIDVVESNNKFKIYKIIDDKLNNEKKKYKSALSKEFLKKEKRNKNIHISFASIYKLGRRGILYKKLKNNKFNFPVIKSNMSYIAKDTKVLAGTIIMHNAFINSGCKIGENVVVNTNALIEHDVVIGFNSHISTGTIINGGVKIGKNCFIGSGSVLKENINISDNSFINMGSIVTKNV